MNRIFDRLDDRERKALVRLGLAAFVFLTVSAVVYFRTKGAYHEVRASLVELETARAKAVKDRGEAESEWLRWQEAGEDLETLGTDYFYRATEGVTALRLDLQRIFALAGLTVSDIGYGYSDLDKEQARKTIVTFSYSGSYAGLKKLLGIIERFPRFLVIERIDFPKTGSDGGSLVCKLTLAGYYES
jgi:hypothetical protein